MREFVVSVKLNLLVLQIAFAFQIILLIFNFITGN